MPDLLTHAATGYLLGRYFYSGHRIALIVLGSILPDVLTRVPEIVLHRFLGLPVAHFFAAFHTPTSLAVVCYSLSFLFAETQRRLSFLLMLSGALIHFLLDLMQEQFYHAKYMPYFPFSFKTLQWSLIHINVSLIVAPVLLLTALWLWRKDTKNL